MLNIKKIREHGVGFTVLWDLFMLFAVIVNLHLIAFDMTYLTLRPYYFKHAPKVIEIYDPILGIEPHRITEEQLILVDKLKKANALTDSEEKNKQISALSEELKISIKKILDENPFEKSGQTGNLQEIKRKVKLFFESHPENIKIIEMKKALDPNAKVISSTDAFKWFWTIDEKNIEERIKFFDEEIRFLLEVNYYRQYALSGGYVDKFYEIDAPFFILFLFEFLVQWGLAIKRKTHPAWFIYPLYHWYDILGLMPIAQLRFFRLFRMVQIYMYLKESDYLNVGDDMLSRTIRYYSNIVKEEISDMVTIRILSETQEEIRSGGGAAVIINTIENRRSEIKQLVIENMKNSLPKTRETIARVLPKLTLAKLYGGNADAEVGMIIDAVLDDVLISLNNREMNRISDEITIEILENTKKNVAKKKWLDTKI